MNNNNGRGIFYGVIGVATLVVAIIGATFAYFTAQASNENTITGNAATISMSVAVSKVSTADVDKGGMIPMSNTMVEAALSGKTGTANVCVDDNGNAVCQVYKIVLTNISTAAIMVDGYMALVNGSGDPTDYPDGYSAQGNNPTTMRWAQAFCSADGTDTLSCSTAGTVNLGGGGTVAMTAIGNSADTTGKNKANIRTSFTTAVGDGGTKGSATINGSAYDVIGTNYIRISDHQFTATGVTTDGIGNDVAASFSGDEVYDREDDATAALVYNQYVPAGQSVTYYAILWLAETGTNQTPGSTGAAADGVKFFNGQVKFVSANGSEVSATFQNYARTAATGA